MVRARWHVVRRPAGAEIVALGNQFADQVGDIAIVGVAADAHPHSGHDAVSALGEVDVDEVTTLVLNKGVPVLVSRNRCRAGLATSASRGRERVRVGAGAAARARLRKWAV